MQFIVNIMIFIVILSIIGLVLVLLFKDKGQNQHSVLRNYPVLGRVRYFAEKIGPELRQYLFANDTEETIFKKPVHKYCARVNTTLECLVLEHNESIRMDFTYEIQCFLYNVMNYKLIIKL